MRKTDPIKDKKSVNLMYTYYLKKGSYRNFLLIAIGLYTALRISDILRMKWSDVLTEDGKIKGKIVIKEKKTGKNNSVSVNKTLKRSIEIYLKNTGDKEGYIFKGRNKEKPLNRTQAYRIVKKAAEDLKLEGNISCHSLRKTVGYHMYLDNVQPVLLMAIYNHSSFEITKRYLCITQYEKDEAFNNLSYELTAC